METTKKFYAMVDYYPAEVKKGKEVYVAFHVRHPVTDLMVRKRVRLNKIKSVKERDKIAKKLCQDINMKLARGWNPLTEKEAPKSFTKIFDAMETFLNVKKKESRDDTIRTYASYHKIFKQWIVENRPADLYCMSFSRNDAIDFTNYLYNPEGRNLQERSFNGFLVYLNSLFNWMVVHQYVRENHFKVIKRKKPKPKARKIIPFETREVLKDYLLRTEKQEFYCMVLLGFYGLIRPQEILSIRIRDLQLDRGIIVLPAEINKDGQDRFVSIPDFVVDEIRKLPLNEYPTSYYIFSEKFKPGKLRINRRVLSNYWARVIRPGAGIPDEIQFYSLKDSGIMQLLTDGVPPHEVKDQAGHSSLDMTNEYLKHVRPQGSEKIKRNSTKF